mmetsp:Transcript_14789/g.22582  ORF Transcript_14789/g.22582 Transcript_14789/m.22582 type:complete len:108 (+) Transcript_14789:4763-5086(+)
MNMNYRTDPLMDHFPNHRCPMVLSSFLAVDVSSYDFDGFVCLSWFRLLSRLLSVRLLVGLILNLYRFLLWGFWALSLRTLLVPKHNITLPQRPHCRQSAECLKYDDS